MKGTVRHSTACRYLYELEETPDALIDAHGVEVSVLLAVEPLVVDPWHLHVGPGLVQGLFRDLHDRVRLPERLALGLQTVQVRLCAGGAFRECQRQHKPDWIGRGDFGIMFF